MHGRAHRLALATLVAALIPAVPAAADEHLGVGQPAAVDGVVTAWRVDGAGGQTLRLRSEQPLSGGGTAVTATSDPVVFGDSGAAARLPIAAGGTLRLQGTSGSPTLTATVEPDVDGDGYGDSTQDACPDDVTAHELARCVGTTTFGSPLTLQPDPAPGSGDPVQVAQTTAPGTRLTAPKTGILVRWRVRTQTGYGDVVLQLLRPASPGSTTFTVVAESAPVRATTTDVITVGVRAAVQAGDVLGVRTVDNADGNADLGAVAPHTGDDLTRDGTTTVHDRRLLVQADVEPDADNDGKGDISQDSADLQLTGQANDPHVHAYTIKNLGPDTAQNITITYTSAQQMLPVPPGVSCPYLLAQSCTIASLPAGQSVTLTPAPLLTYWGLHVLEATSGAAITALTPDPNHANDAAVSLRSRFLDDSPQHSDQVPPGLCFNVIRGTRDDDVLRGTAFPDRLVGGDGGDLLKGLGGDDCLEGGAGNDVLDGGDGNDRLAGSSGRDRLIGGKGDDKLTGGKGNDRLSGGSGNDTLSPGAGHDAIDGGPGNDTINSVDGVRETVICGSGRDTVRADRVDRLRGCEKITRVGRKTKHKK